MAEYIEREALIKAIKVHETAENDRIETGYNWALDDIEEIVKQMPAADVKPVRYSSWKYTTYPIVDFDGASRYCATGYVCKACGHSEKTMAPYCGGCGATMRGEDNG